MSRRLLAGVTTLTLALICCSGPLAADDYQWIRYERERQRVIDVDPKICRLYEENLRYFARQNVPMSCNRPIAPHLRDRIKEVEWEDLDPELYSGILSAIAVRYPFISETSEAERRGKLDFYREAIGKRVMVFRRAKVYLVGTIHAPMNYQSEPYWIIQFGYFDISPGNPDKVYRCTPKRGGRERESELQLYVVSEAELKLRGELWNADPISNEGQLLRLIDGRLFIDNIQTKGVIGLNELDPKTPISDQICVFRFKKSSERDR